jgi:DNA-binding phage protein
MFRLSIGNVQRQVVRGHQYVIDWGPGYRLYLAEDGRELIILFGGGTKRRQQADIIRAKELHADSMALTREFRQTVFARVQREPAFAKTLLDEAATLFLNGEPESARLILRELVNATVGFEKLAVLTEKPSKSLHRMLSQNGNPSMDNLAAIFDAVRRKLKVGIKVRTVEAA